VIAVKNCSLCYVENDLPLSVRERNSTIRAEIDGIPGLNASTRLFLRSIPRLRFNSSAKRRWVRLDLSNSVSG
jgi:hypothetical protein